MKKRVKDVDMKAAGQPFCPRYMEDDLFLFHKVNEFKEVSNLCSVQFSCIKMP